MALRITEAELAVLLSAEDKASAVLAQVSKGITEIDVASLGTVAAMEELTTQESELIPTTSALDSVSTTAAHSLLRLSGGGTMAGRAVLTLANSVKIAMPELLLITAVVAAVTSAFRAYQAAQEELTAASEEWRQQVIDGAEAEESAHLTLFKLEEAQRKWREEFEKAHPIQSLFISDAQVANETIEERLRLQAKLSSSYDDFLPKAREEIAVVVGLSASRSELNSVLREDLALREQFNKLMPLESLVWLESEEAAKSLTHEQRMLNVEVEATPEYLKEVTTASDRVIAKIREQADSLYDATVAWSQHFSTVAESQRDYEDRRASIISEGNARATRLQEDFTSSWEQRAEDLSRRISEIQATRNDRIQDAERAHSDALARIGQQLENRLSDISRSAQEGREDTLRRHLSRLEDIRQDAVGKVAKIMAKADDEIADIQAKADDKLTAEMSEHERIMYNLGLIGDTQAQEREKVRHAEQLAWIGKTAAEEEAEIREAAEEKAAEEQARIDKSVAREKKAFAERMARIDLQAKRQEEAAERQHARALAQEEKANERRMAEARAYGEQQIASLNAAFARQHALAQEALEEQLAQQEAAEQKRLADLEKTRAKQLEDQKLAEGRQLISTIDYWVESGEITAAEGTKIRDEIAEKYGLITEDGRKFIENLRRRTNDWVRQQDERARAIEDFSRRGIKAVRDLRWELDMLRSLPGPFSIPTGFQYGGIVPGSFGAAQPVTAHGGEMILNPQQQSQLFSMLSRPNFTMNVQTRATTDTVRMGFETVRALYG